MAFCPGPTRGGAKCYPRPCGLGASSGALRFVTGPGAVPLELSIQRLPVEPEDPRREGLIVPDGLQDAQDVTTFYLLQGGHLGGIVAHNQHLRTSVVSNLLGQVLYRELLIKGQSYGSLDAVLELADVARPGVGEELFRRRGREALDALSGSKSKMLREMLAKEQDVVASRAQRRHLKLNDVQPEEEVLAKAP